MFVFYFFESYDTFFLLSLRQPLLLVNLFLSFSFFLSPIIIRFFGIERRFLNLFGVLPDSDAFGAKFNCLEHPVKQFSEGAETAAVPAGEEIMQKRDFKVSPRYSVLKEYLFLTRKSLQICEL